jgi:thioredoxin-dependent peroxiredoxin
MWSVSLRGILQLIFRGSATMLKPGDPAPDFDVTDHNGNRIKLSDLRGQRVVLWFYPKADTPG